MKNLPWFIPLILSRKSSLNWVVRLCLKSGELCCCSSLWTCKTVKDLDPCFSSIYLRNNSLNFLLKAYRSLNRLISVVGIRTVWGILLFLNFDVICPKKEKIFKLIVSREKEPCVGEFEYFAFYGAEGGVVWIWILILISCLICWTCKQFWS